MSNPDYPNPPGGQPGWQQPAGPSDQQPQWGPQGGQPPGGQAPPQWCPPGGQAAGQPAPGQQAWGQQAPAPGYQQPAYAPVPAGYNPADPAAPFGRDPRTGEPYSDKQKLVAGLLQLFVGWTGAGRWYLGDTKIALFQLFTCGGLGIWALIDGIQMLTGNVRDMQGRPLRD